MNDVTTRFMSWLNWLIANKTVKDGKNFALSIGVSASSMTEISKGRTNVGLSIIQKTVLLYPDINPAWLLTGEGEMLRATDGAPTPQQSKPTIYKSNIEMVNVPIGVAVSSVSGGIPLVPVDAAAGFMSGSGTQVMDYECEHYRIPCFHGAEFLIRIVGTSMHPNYESGDVVACKRLPKDAFFQWNRVYVIDSQQGVLIKRVKRGSDDNHITLVSDNVSFEPFELDCSELNSLAIVVGLIRIE